MYKFSYKGCSKDDLLTAIEKYSKVLEPIFGKYSKWENRIKREYIKCLPLIRDGFSEFIFYTSDRKSPILIGEKVLDDFTICMNNSTKVLYLSKIGFVNPFSEFVFRIYFKNGVPNIQHYEYVREYLFNKDGSIKDERMFVNGKSAIDLNEEYIKYFEENVEQSIFKIFVKC